MGLVAPRKAKAEVLWSIQSPLFCFVLGLLLLPKCDWDRIQVNPAYQLAIGSKIVLWAFSVSRQDVVFPIHVTHACELIERENQIFDARIQLDSEAIETAN